MRKASSSLYALVLWKQTSL